METMFSAHKTKEQNSQFLYIAGPFHQRCPVLHLASMPMPWKSTSPHNVLSNIALEASHLVLQLTNKCYLVWEKLPAALQLVLVALYYREIVLKEF